MWGVIVIILRAQNLRSFWGGGFSSGVFRGRGGQLNCTLFPFLCLVYPGNTCLMSPMGQNGAGAGDSKVTQVCPRVSSMQGDREASKPMTQVRGASG